MYQEVAEPRRSSLLPRAPAAELFGYEPEWLDRAPPAPLRRSRCGNPHLRSRLQAGKWCWTWQRRRTRQHHRRMAGGADGAR